MAATTGTGSAAMCPISWFHWAGLRSLPTARGAAGAAGPPGGAGRRVGGPRGGLRGGRALRRHCEDDLDVGAVVGTREGARGPRVAHQADDLLRDEFALQGQEGADRKIGDRPGALVAGDRHAVQLRDRDPVAAVGHGDVSGDVIGAGGAAQRAHGRLQRAAREEREQRQNALVDRPGGDFPPRAGVHHDARVREDIALQLAL